MPLVNGTGNSPAPGQPTPGVVKQDKSSGGSVDTTKTRSGPQRVRMSSGERPMGATKGKQSDTEALCQAPPPPKFYCLPATHLREGAASASRLPFPYDPFHKRAVRLQPTRLPDCLANGVPRLPIARHEPHGRVSQCQGPSGYPAPPSPGTVRDISPPQSKSPFTAPQPMGVPGEVPQGRTRHREVSRFPAQVEGSQQILFIRGGGGGQRGFEAPTHP